MGQLGSTKLVVNSGRHGLQGCSFELATPTETFHILPDGFPPRESQKCRYSLNKRRCAEHMFGGWVGVSRLWKAMNTETHSTALET
jgi:hypothetical protein